MGNEAEFIERIGRAGFKAWWIRDAAVEHLIRSEQIDRKWMLRRAVRYGSGSYRLDAEAEGRRKSIAGMPPWVMRRAVEQVYRLAASSLRGNERDRFVARWYLNYYWGILVEARRMRNSRGPGDERPEMLEASRS